MLKWHPGILDSCCYLNLKDKNNNQSVPLLRTYAEEKGKKQVLQVFILRSVCAFKKKKTHTDDDEGVCAFLVI